MKLLHLFINFFFESFLHFCWNYLHKKLFPPLFCLFYFTFFFILPPCHPPIQAMLLKKFEICKQEMKNKKKRRKINFYICTHFFRWKYLHAIMLFKQVITFYVELSSMRGEKHDVASSWRIFMMLLCNESFIAVFFLFGEIIQ